MIANNALIIAVQEGIDYVDLMNNSRRPVVLCLSGHDPSGGAGIQADIEAIHALGSHAVSVITCLTRQDTHNVYEVKAVEADFIVRQAETLIDDIKIDAIKIGLIGSLENISAIQHILKQLPQTPVVLDPVLAAGGGENLSSEEIAQAISSILLPHTTLVTPNIPEAYSLSQSQNLHDCALFFEHLGCDYSLITGTHADTKTVINQLYQGQRCISEKEWPRLPHTYHGSGCTIASAIAALLAQEKEIKQAVEVAQEYTWNSLNKATTQGTGQHIPCR